MKAEGWKRSRLAELHPSSFRLHPCAGPRSSGVERLLGKEEVMSSNLIAGSIAFSLRQQFCLFDFFEEAKLDVKGKIWSQ
jgi:hypothetical protein